MIKALYFGYPTELRPPILPIAKMTWSEGKYYYSYTGAYERHRSSIPGLSSMMINPDCGFNQTWVLDRPHGFLNSKIPRRPDSMKVYDLLGLSERKGDFIAYFARDGDNLGNHFRCISRNCFEW